MGFCAGVERAVDAVEHTLDLHGAPVYVRKQIVHNVHVVRQLEERGVVFVDELAEVPTGSVAVLSAHGVAPEVHAQGRERGLVVVDATCPLVTKVHMEARRWARDGYTMVLIGHAGHEEVVGTMGEAPDCIVLVQTEDEADALVFPGEPDGPAKLAYITQTTLSVQETASILRRLKARFPQLVGPQREDICYATTNRQAAVRELAEQSDVVLVIGSLNSSNSVRLAEVAREHGTPAWRIDDASEIREEWVSGVTTVGLTSGASAPEQLIDEVCEWFRTRGTTQVDGERTVDEGVRFMLPTELRIALAAAKG